MFPVDSCICDALRLVPRQWRAEFCRFVEEGQASEEFLAFLDRDEMCKQACELVFRGDTLTARLLAAAGIVNGEEDEQCESKSYHANLAKM